LAGEATQAINAAPPPAEPGIYKAVQTGERLYQGEIIANVVEWVPSYAAEALDVVSNVSPVIYDLSVVVTQDCDLEQDWRKRNESPNTDTSLSCVLLCPARFAAPVFNSDPQVRGEGTDRIRKNQSMRYHFLAEISTSADTATVGPGAMLVDFKALFTVRTIELYRQLRVNTNPAKRGFRLETPWAEHLQNRFANYHSRIGLPRDHFVAGARRS
jgi:hypothetical protein